MEPRAKYDVFIHPVTVISLSRMRTNLLQGRCVHLFESMFEKPGPCLNESLEAVRNMALQGILLKVFGKHGIVVNSSQLFGSLAEISVVDF